MDLAPGTDRAALGRLLRTWTGSIEALMAGRPAPGDTAPALASAGTGLSVTVGLGPTAISVAGSTSTIGLDLPSFANDRLVDAWSAGDAVLQICADDPTTVTHATRALLRDAAPFGTLRWRQSGFSGIRPDGAHRNAMGSIEGTGNPPWGGPELADTVWRTDGPGWLVGGTTMVVRRIRMDLDGWDRLAPDDQDRVIGRRTSDGAARGRDSITDDPDFDLLDTAQVGHVHGDGELHRHEDQPVGLAIPEDAHVRRAHPAFNGGRRLLRRGYSYADDDGTHGLVFISYQRDPDAFVAIQRSLDDGDALNRWTTPIGSAAFAVLPGCLDGEYLGQRLIEG
jgi:dye decolorizing peroxidase